VLGELEGSTEQAHCHRVSVNNKPTGLSTCLEKKLKYWPTLPRVGYRSNPRVNIYIYLDPSGQIVIPRYNNSPHDDPGQLCVQLL
jgi:ribosomal protein L32E